MQRRIHLNLAKVGIEVAVGIAEHGPVGPGAGRRQIISEHECTKPMPSVAHKSIACQRQPARSPLAAITRIFVHCIQTLLHAVQISDSTVDPGNQIRVR